MKTTTIRIPDALHLAVKRHSVETDRSFNQIITDAIYEKSQTFRFEPKEQVTFNSDELRLISNALLEIENDANQKIRNGLGDRYFDEDAGIFVSTGDSNDFFAKSQLFGISSLAYQIRTSLPKRQARKGEVEIPEMARRFVPMITMALQYYRSDAGIQARAKRLVGDPEEEISPEWESALDQCQVDESAFRKIFKKLEQVDAYK